MPANLPGIHLVDWIILAIYVVAILAIGIWSATKIKDATDFFMGGRRFGKFFTMFFAFGSGTSSDGHMSDVAAGTWRGGLASIWWQFLWLPVMPFFWLIAPLLRRLRAITTADFFGTRFSPSVAVLYSVYGIIMSIVLIAAGLYGSGKMINAISGNSLEEIAIRKDIQVPSISLQWVTVEDPAIPKQDRKSKLTISVRERRMEGHEFAILAIAVLLIAYGMMGGLGAVITTDFLQGILTLILSLLLLPFVLSKIGGLGAVHDAADAKPGLVDFAASADVAEALGQEPMTGFFIFMLSLTALMGFIVQPHIVGICGAGRTEFEGRFGLTVGNFLRKLCTAFWTFTGMACIALYLSASGPLATSADPAERALYQDLTARASGEYEALPKEASARVDMVDQNFADELFGRAAYDILPAICPGLIGLLLVSLVASIMSSSDTQMVMSSGLFTENVYKKHIVPFRSEMHYVWVGRIAGLLIVVAALVMQTMFTDVLQAMKAVIKTPAIIGVSMWFGLFWRRWNPTAVWTSTICGALTWYYVGNYGTEIYESILPIGRIFRTVDDSLVMSDAWQMFFVLAITVGSGFIAAMVTMPQSEMQLDRFYTLLQTPVEPDEQVIIPCRVPEDSRRRDPVIEWGDWRIPKPTKPGLMGFGLSWLAVLGIIAITWLFSRML